MTPVLPPLDDDDREALRRTARDLSDISIETRDRINAGFAHAHQVAEQIRLGVRDPLR
jgi:hypothetical protein